MKKNTASNEAVFEYYCLIIGTDRLFSLSDSCLSCCESCDRHTEGRARNVGQTYLMAELNGGGVTTVLTADTELDVGAGLAAEVCCESYELTYAGLVELSEGIVLIDLLIIVSREELTCIVGRWV